MNVALARFLRFIISLCLAAVITQSAGGIFVADEYVNVSRGGIEQIPVTIFFYFCISVVVRFAAIINRCQRVKIAIFSFLLSIAIFVGNFIERKSIVAFGNGDLLSKALSFISLVGLCYYSVLICIAGLYKIRGVEATVEDWFMRSSPAASFIVALSHKPFRVSFSVLLLVWLPIAVLYYPGLFMGDTVDQICQTLPELKEWKTFTVDYCSVRQLNEAVRINTHHPVVHTMLLASFLRLGLDVFQSASFGFFLYTVFQTLVCCSLFALIVHFISVRCSPRPINLLILLICIAFNPYILFYIPVATKDVIYGAVYALFLCAFFLCIRSSIKEKLSFWILLCSITGIILLRNESKYLLPLWGISGCITCPQLRKKMPGVLLLIVGVPLILQCVYSAFSITPGSKREMLSLPFQQTARYCRHHPNDVSMEELEVIEKIIDPKQFPAYEPSKSDNIKNTFREKSTRKDLYRYFAVWSEMFLRHPRTYIESTVSNHYMWLYASHERPLLFYGILWSADCMKKVTQNAGKCGYHFDHASVQCRWLSRMESWRNRCSSYMVAHALLHPSSCVWCILFLALLAWCKRNKKAAVILIYPLLTIAILPLGPCNGYYSRYIVPIAFSLPILIFSVLSLTFSSHENDSHSHPVL